MAARNRHMNMLNHNSCSDDTTSGTSRSTESETQGSYHWDEEQPTVAGGRYEDTSSDAAFRIIARKQTSTAHSSPRGSDN